MATDVGLRGSRTRVLPAARLAVPNWPGPAWGAIGVTALFLGITSWWLTQDHTIPVYDAGLHLGLAIDVYEDLGSGNIIRAFTHSVPYPPFAYLIASLGMLIGGVAVAPPILAENFVFASLLALGCYKLGKLAFGPLAGMLAVVFALGSPLITAQFHVFMPDAPEAGMAAVSVWLIIATKGFSRLKTCVFAGVAVGFGMLTKEPLAIYVVGIVGVTLWRGGRQSWRGFAVFAVVALAIALPWYIGEWNQIQTIGTEASSSSSSYTTYRIPEVAPPRFSSANLEWYLWNFVNAQIYLPLFLFAVVGWLWTIAGFVRRRPVSRLAIELTVGAFVSWFILTETFIHDTRYSMPILVYLAVFGAGWIERLPGRWRAVAATALVLVALANTLGMSFSAGKKVQFILPGATAGTLQQPGTVTVFEDTGFLVSGPRHDGDLLGVMRAMRRDGVSRMGWPPAEAQEPDFSEAGLYVFGQIAGIKVISEEIALNRLTIHDAIFAHGPVKPNEPPPCIRLYDGTGVWIRLGDPATSGAKDYCPLPKPHFYGG